MYRLLSNKGFWFSITKGNICFLERSHNLLISTLSKYYHFISAFFSVVFLKIFLCEPFLKSLLKICYNIVSIVCVCVCVCVCLAQSGWDLSSLTRDWSCIPCVGRRNLNHWTDNKVPVALFFKFANRAKLGERKHSDVEILAKGGALDIGGIA